MNSIDYLNYILIIVFLILFFIYSVIYLKNIIVIEDKITDCNDDKECTDCKLSCDKLGKNCIDWEFRKFKSPERSVCILKDPRNN